MNEEGFTAMVKTVTYTDSYGTLRMLRFRDIAAQHYIPN